MGFTLSPWADATSPAAKTLRAAFTSRSWVDPHSGQVHERVSSNIFRDVWPQSLQRLLDGYHLSMPISVRPYHSALYVSCRTNSDQLASLIDFARRLFFCKLRTARLSMAITWFSFINRVESLCRKSLRLSAILACSFATFSFALIRRAEPFCFFASLRCNFASLVAYVRNGRGALIFSPVDRVAKYVSPKSIPTRPFDFSFGCTASSQRIETWYRPAVSLDTVTVVGLIPFGNGRDHRIARGSSILASLSDLPSHLKALLVYSADWTPFLRWKLGYFARFAKKLVNAACRCLSACCIGTELTSFNHACSGVFLSAVNAVEVSW